jgi:hypothetical protein
MKRLPNAYHYLLIFRARNNRVIFIDIAPEYFSCAEFGVYYATSQQNSFGFRCLSPFLRQQENREAGETPARTRHCESLLNLFLSNLAPLRESVGRL